MNETLNNYTDLEEVSALLFFLVSWMGYSFYSSRANRHENSLLALTNRYRLQWMHQMLKRDNRMIDATMVGNLMRSITFFASTTIFFVLGLMTMLGYHDHAAEIISAIPFAKPTTSLMFEVKIFLLVIIFIYAFFKYTWSLRQYNFACIFLVAAPAHNERLGEHDLIASRGAYLVESAAEHFNNGLRAYYFGLAALAWFLHPKLFVAATVWVIMVTYRREFRSRTLKHLRS
jgi:uncharacterized membrane protein